MTLTAFNRLYKQYKDNFDFELTLKLAKTTYAKAYEQANKDEEWF